MSSRKTVPYTIIGGYLGAGKTTLLNDLLRNAGGLRLAVLINDFGDINIDADLISSHNGETINLANGCICCSLSDGFSSALNRLRKRADAIDHVIVEASGVADPVKVGQYGAILGFELAGIIVLADAEQVTEKAANKYVGETVQRQLQGADVIVLNKCDLLPPADLQHVRTWLHRLSPDAGIVEASFGHVPLELLLHPIHRFAHEGHSSPAAPEPVNHQHDYDSWSFESDTPLGPASLERFVNGLPDGILRSKGVLLLSSNRSSRTIFQLVGKQSNVSTGEPWGNDPPMTKLVVIGLPGSIDADYLRDLLLAP